MTDLVTHLTRQAAFSRATFGPGPRTKGITDHIKKELVEVEKCYDPTESSPLSDLGPVFTREPTDAAKHAEAAKEWVDVAMLGLDGLIRAISAANPDWTFEHVAARAVKMIVGKQGKNELRDWPDWRQADPDAAIEHERGKHD